MPEGDTVYVAAERLQRALSGRSLTRADLRVPSLATSDLTGRTIQEVIPRGKYLLFRMDDNLTLITHFKMEGSWHIYRPGARWKGPDHQVRAILGNDRWIAVGFRLARVELVTREGEAEVVGHLGPDVLGPDWDEERVVHALRGQPDRLVHDALLDQSIMAGPGNVYRCEACFLTGLHPDTLVGNVPDLAALVRLMKRLMDANRTTGNQITTGDPRPGRSHWVYGRRGLPCRRCGTSITRAEDRGVTGRVTYWCPRCQPQRGFAGGFSQGAAGKLLRPERSHEVADRGTAVES